MDRYFTNKKGTRNKLVFGKGSKARTLHTAKTTDRYRTRRRKAKRK